ncbi:hypothetical protein LJR225_001528 [Phenylobacterium sp. LjRoot225]|uniref:hypothetical protein n=1 Tax=Phenylobacterium sp. LjRoot225 TaxID=3342285 RepID=UPI003ECD8D68
MTTASEDDYKGAIVVSGADAKFFDLLREMVTALRAANGPGLEIGVYDLGLASDQLEWLAGQGVITVQPRTELRHGITENLSSKLGYLARPFLRENFPGRRTYVWMDADTWVQSASAARTLVGDATRHGSALVRENAPNYRFRMDLFLWKAKHFVLGYGPINGLRLLLKPHVNNGVFALRADAPHWERWRRRYQRALDRTGQAAPHDQFGLNAAVYLDRLDTHFLPATYNWICDLALPLFNSTAQNFCTPRGEAERIEVMHLAGPIKTTVFQIDTTGGGRVSGRLRFGAALTPEG